MKNTINKLSLLSFFLLGLFACEKEEDQVITEFGDAPTLSASANSLELSREVEENEAVTFSWTELPVTWSHPDYATEGVVSYVLEIDSAGNNFENPEMVDMGSELNRTFTIAQFNRILLDLGFLPGDEALVEARVRISNNTETILSNVVTIEATPYSTEIEAVYVYVPGAYQGWDPASAAVLASEEDDGVYEGIVTFPGEAEADREFKITSQPDWNGINYGDGGDGVLSTDGGAGNLSVPEPYTYKIIADLNELTWSAEKHSWAIVGDATGSWDDDTDMTFDNREGVWKITTDLTAGELKFRFNDAWDLNYGDDDPSNDTLNAGGANIPVTEAGTYEIILDVSDEENPTYSITKL